MATQNDGDNKKKAVRKKPSPKSRPAAASAKKPASRSRAAKTPASSARKTEKISGKPAPEAQAASYDTSADKSAPERKTANIADHIWHLIAVVAFMLIADIALVFLLFPLAVIQLIVVIIDGKPNEEVEAVLSVIKAYIIECLHFMVFRTEEMPFPFSPLPKADRSASNH